MTTEGASSHPAGRSDDDGPATPGIAGPSVPRDPFLVALLDAAVDGVVISDQRGVILLINAACCRMFGFAEAELLGRSVNHLMPHPIDHEHDRAIERYLDTGDARIIGRGRETLARDKTGRIFPIHLSVGHARVGTGHYFVGFIRDISDKLEAEQRAHFLELHDALTGVLSRQALLDAAREALEGTSGDDEVNDSAQHISAAAERWGDTGDDPEARRDWALFTVDVDQFSDVNEAFGSHVGDMALKALVARIGEVLPRETIIGRVAADEFTAMSLVEGLEHAETLGQALFDRLTASIYAERHWVRLRVSIGAAMSQGGDFGVDELNNRAKLALQSVQQAGGNAMSFYSPEMAASASRRMMLTLQLSHAIDRGELSIAYQPIVEGRTGRIVALEALMRWNHPALGAVSPVEFIPVAEESGLIIQMTDWVFTRVAVDMTAWEGEGIGPRRVYMNISALQFLRGNLVQRVTGLLADNPWLTDRLGLEITEQVALRDPDVAVRTIAELAGMKVEFAIDDFGSGYSSLSYVQQLPVAKLKIDRTFVIGVPGSDRNAALVRAAVGMAHGLKLSVVAEGVETEAQRDFLVSVGCDALQGYLFGRPASFDDTTERLRAQSPASGA